MKKLYIIQKYVVARSIQEALRIEGKQLADEIWLDEDWKKAHKPDMGEKKTGFKAQDTALSRRIARK